MADDVLLNKAAMIERCVMRAREEYATAGDSFEKNYSRQDAAILNIQRACDAAIDAGQHLVRRERIGIPQSSADVFALLARADLIPLDLSKRLEKMVGFRNISVHEYQRVSIPIVEAIIRERLDDFLEYSSILLKLQGK